MSNIRRNIYKIYGLFCLVFLIFFGKSPFWKPLVTKLGPLFLSRQTGTPSSIVAVPKYRWSSMSRTVSMKVSQWTYLVVFGLSDWITGSCPFGVLHAAKLVTLHRIVLRWELLGLVIERFVEKRTLLQMQKSLQLPLQNSRTWPSRSLIYVHRHRLLPQRRKICLSSTLPLRFVLTILLWWKCWTTPVCHPLVVLFRKSPFSCRRLPLCWPLPLR